MKKIGFRKLRILLFGSVMIMVAVAIMLSSSSQNKEIETKQNYLSRFLKVGFPNRNLENWKFSDLSQIIKKSIGELSFYNDYSSSNKVDSSIFVDGLEHNKIVFINGRIEKIEFNYEDENNIEILDEVEVKDKPNFENSLIDLNNAFTNKYYKIVVKEDYALKKPLIIYHTTKENIFEVLKGFESTKGKNGSILYNLNDGNFVQSDAFAKKVVDKIGSGDAMLALISLCLKSKFGKELSLLIGSLAAAYSTETMANKEPVSKVKVIKALEHILK